MQSMTPEELQAVRLPPCGGSGLKFYAAETVPRSIDVSLHAEGVD